MLQKQNFPYGCINELGVFPAVLNATFEQFEVFHMMSSKFKLTFLVFTLMKYQGS